jgi:hypothetical protein
MSAAGSRWDPRPFSPGEAGAFKKPPAGVGKALTRSNLSAQPSPGNEIAAVWLEEAASIPAGIFQNLSEGV